MNLSDFFGVFGLFVSALSVPKIIKETVFIKLDRMESEYRFVKEFFNDLENESIPDMVKECGFAALSKSGQVNLEEAEYLMKFKDPIKSLRYFAFAKPHLVFKEFDGAKIITFKEKWFLKQGCRKFAQKTLEAFYFIFLFIPSIPLIFQKNFGGVGNSFNYFLWLLLFFVIPSFVCLWEALRIDRAEKIVNYQYKK